MTNQTPLHILAGWLSGVFHPLLMPLWCVAAVVFGGATTLTYTTEIALFVVLSVARIALVVPLIFAALLRVFGFLSKRGGAIRRSGERRLLLLTVAICLVCCGGMFAPYMVLFVVRKVLYAAAAVCVALVVLEWLWPVSIHCTAIGAVLGMWWILLFVGNVQLLVPFVVGVVVAGLLCSARILLHPERSPWRSIVGLVGGFALCSLLFVLL